LFLGGAAVERLERIAVQLAEAKRLSEPGDVPHSRLALLLADNAVETLMHFECVFQVGMDQDKERRLALLERLPSPTAEDFADLAKLKSKVLTDKRKEKIEREFGPKVDLLVERKTPGLTRVVGRCLKKLHKYRNETYHLDKVRPEILNTAVAVYFYLCCELLAEMPVRWITTTSRKVYPGLVEALGRSSSAYSPSFGEQRQVAEWLLSGTDVASTGVEKVLADHLVARLEEFDEYLELVASTMDELTGSGWTGPDVLILVQLKEGVIDPRSPVEEYRKISVPVDRKKIAKWYERGRKIADIRPTTAAFAAFADLEDAFERVDDSLRALGASVNEQESFRFDDARGKLRWIGITE
jgi:hypothetical protein